ncbi:MAG: four helix bundle protein [Fimbriimonadaceae bacterium]|nr:four helix bundle protein [Fimbriimonadaceae bacterium]
MSQYQPIEDLEVFKVFETVASWAWNEVSNWGPFSQGTVGTQLVRAIDSVGANLAEGDGRFGEADAVKFFIYARGSAREARLWITRAQERGLLTSDAQVHIEAIDIGLKLLSGLIKFRRQSYGNRVREEVRDYGA